MQISSKTMSSPASLSLKGQATKHTTAKMIYVFMACLVCMHNSLAKFVGLHCGKTLVMRETINT